MYIYFITDCFGAYDSIQNINQPTNETEYSGTLNDPIFINS